MDWRERLRLGSEACLQQLVESHPEFSVDAHQPSYRGGTHYVTFGRYRKRPAVFKYFVAARRWENEAACLTLLADSGLVPRLFYQKPGTLLVMERLGGNDVLNELSGRVWKAEETDGLSREIGAAFGRLASTAPRTSGIYDPFTDFPDWGWNRGLSDVAGRCLRDGRKIVDSVEPSYSETLAASLDLIEERLSIVECEAAILFHEDASNLRVADGRFVAFYDLEICRGGTPSMQLGAALNLCGEGRLDWPPLVAGFEKTSGFAGSNPRSILAMNYLSSWIRICESLRPFVDEERLEKARGDAQAQANAMGATARILSGFV